MNRIVLENIAYLFYPKDIDAMKQKEVYINSYEYKTLTKSIVNTDNKNSSSINFSKYKEKVIIQLNHLNFLDGTLLHWLDRAYNYQFYMVKNNKIYSLCINISLLIPYYTIYALEVDINPNTSKWENYPREIEKIANSTFKKEILELSRLTEEYLGYSLFPEKLINVIIEDISFQDIKKEKFTFFNAFFLNEKNIRT